MHTHTPTPALNGISLEASSVGFLFGESKSPYLYTMLQFECGYFEMSVWLFVRYKCIQDPLKIQFPNCLFLNSKYITITKVFIGSALVWTG